MSCVTVLGFLLSVIRLGVFSLALLTRMSNKFASILLINSFIESILKIGLGFLFVLPWIRELFADDLLPNLGLA